MQCKHAQLPALQRLPDEVASDEHKHVGACARGKAFGPQPFLAIKDKSGKYFHDNFDFSADGEARWSYVLDEQTIPLSAVSEIGVGSAGLFGGYSVEILRLN